MSPAVDSAVEALTAAWDRVVADAEARSAFYLAAITPWPRRRRGPIADTEAYRLYQAAYKHALRSTFQAGGEFRTLDLARWSPQQIEKAIRARVRKARRGADGA